MVESRLLQIQHERDELRAENTRHLLSIQELCKEVERLREELARRNKDGRSDQARGDRAQD